MGSHLVLFGPSTAGKTSLMLGLTRLRGECSFTVDRTWTTRQKRPSEGDGENVFASNDEFAANKLNFLFTFSTFPTYEYGIERPKPVAKNEIRMRILMPIFAHKFRQLVSEPTIFCSVSPFNSDPESVFRMRDPNVDPDDLRARMSRFHQDKLEADSSADIHFQNTEGLGEAVRRLGSLLLGNVNIGEYKDA